MNESPLQYSEANGAYKHNSNWINRNYKLGDGE